MEVPLTPEKEAQLSKLASENGRDANALAQEVLVDYLEQQARFVEAVKAGEAALERGDYLTHEQVGIQLNMLLRS
ncbi:MAG: hypothetical protein HY299_02710 [Verrucomicrobia bacterium]|nr:hypothetical protein [Verrucomicrobiota bacterium]